MHMRRYWRRATPPVLQLSSRPEEMSHIFSPPLLLLEKQNTMGVFAQTAYAITYMRIGHPKPLSFRLEQTFGVYARVILPYITLPTAKLPAMVSLLYLQTGPQNILPCSPLSLSPPSPSLPHRPPSLLNRLYLSYSIFLSENEQSSEHILFSGNPDHQTLTSDPCDWNPHSVT